MLLYIDSLFAEGGDREVRPLHSIPDSLNELYVLAMREHRRTAVLAHWDGEHWQPTPDWRLDRHVIRVALQLQQRLEIRRGDRIALISDLQPEWPLVDLAALGLGAVSVSIPASGSRQQLGAAVAETRPRVVFLAAETLGKLRPLLDLFDEIELLVLFDGEPEDEEKMQLLSSVIDLGGTLDTPERAQAFRSRVREASPDDGAIRHYEFTESGGTSFTDLTQAEIVERLNALWLSGPAIEGDVVYMTGSEVTLEARLALYALIGDGYSTIHVGTPGREMEIAELHPHKIVAPASIIEAALEGREAAGDGENGHARSQSAWARLKSGLKRSGRERERPTNPIIEALGGRVRWVGPTTPLDPAVSALLSAAVAVGMTGTVAINPVSGDAATERA